MSEQFSALWMDQNHSFVKRRAESTFGAMDTGIKLGMIFCLWSEDSKGSLRLFKQQSLGKTNPSEHDALVDLRTNSLLIFNARAFEYEITGVQGKTVLLTNFVPGPP